MTAGRGSVGLSLPLGRQNRLDLDCVQGWALVCRRTEQWVLISEGFWRSHQELGWSHSCEVWNSQPSSGRVRAGRRVRLLDFLCEGFLTSGYILFAEMLWYFRTHKLCSSRGRTDSGIVSGGWRVGPHLRVMWFFS